MYVVIHNQKAWLLLIIRNKNLRFLKLRELFTCYRARDAFRPIAWAFLPCMHNFSHYLQPVAILDEIRLSDWSRRVTCAVCLLLIGYYPIKRAILLALIRISNRIISAPIILLLYARRLCNRRFQKQPFHPKWGPPGGAFDFRVKKSVSGGKKRISQLSNSARAPRSRVIILVDFTWFFCCCRFI